MLKRGPLPSLEGEGGLYIWSVQSSVCLTNAEVNIVRNFAGKFLKHHILVTLEGNLIQHQRDELSCHSPVLHKIAKLRVLAKES